MTPFHIRSVAPSDMNFIYSSWLKSAQEDVGGPKTQFFETYRDHVKSLIERSEILVACDKTDPDFVHGYIVFQKIDDVFLLHWAYTKARFRKMHVMTGLLKSAFPNFGAEEMVITYRNDKRPKMFQKLKTIYKPNLRGLQK